MATTDLMGEANLFYGKGTADKCGKAIGRMVNWTVLARGCA